MIEDIKDIGDNILSVCQVEEVELVLVGSFLFCSSSSTGTEKSLLDNKLSEVLEHVEVEEQIVDVVVVIFMPLFLLISFLLIKIGRDVVDDAR